MDKTQSDNPRGPTHVRFIVLLWLCGAMALAYIARNVIGVAESTVRGDLGLTKEESGWLMSAFFFSYALLQIPMSQFGKTAGSHRALPLFAILWSLATAAMAAATGLVGLIATRVVQGVAQAGLIPTSIVSVSKWFPKTGRAFATGALGVWLTGLAIDSEEGWGWSWRTLFLVFSVPGLLWALAFWFWFRDEPQEHEAVNRAELDLISGKSAEVVTMASGSEQSVVSSESAVTETCPSTPWLAIATSPALWWICGQQVCRAAGYMFFTSWFATYLQETRGVSVATSGFLNMLPLLAVVVGGFAGGALSDWLLRRTGSLAVARKFMAATCLFLCALLIFCSMAIKDAQAAVLVISLGSFFAALAGPCAYTITIDMGRQHVAAVHSTMNMMGNLGAWAFPIAVPWLLAKFGSWDAVIVVFGAIYVAGAVFWLLLKPEGNILQQSLAENNGPLGQTSTSQQ